MSTLGNQSTAGGTFTISGSFGDVAGGSYTVPNPGIIVSNINAVFDNNGTSGSYRLYIWQNSAGKPGSWLIRGSSTGTTPGSMGTVTQSSLSDNTGISNHFIPGGTVIWIGYYSSTGVSAFQGASSGTGTSELGNTADGNWSDHAPASGIGEIAAWITYTLAGGMYVNTGTPASPVWTPASAVYVNTGTPAAPVWTPATQVAVNTGTPASPVWTPGS